MRYRCGYRYRCQQARLEPAARARGEAPLITERLYGKHSDAKRQKTYSPQGGATPEQEFRRVADITDHSVQRVREQARALHTVSHRPP